MQLCGMLSMKKVLYVKHLKFKDYLFRIKSTAIFLDFSLISSDSGFHGVAFQKLEVESVDFRIMVNLSSKIRKASHKKNQMRMSIDFQLLETASTNWRKFKLTRFKIPLLGRKFASYIFECISNIWKHLSDSWKLFPINGSQ